MAMNHNELSIYYQNCRGIRTKLNTLFMNILSNCYDVIVLTETWLIPTVSNNEFIDNRYVVFRCDRNRTATNKSDGGGVLIAILRQLNPTDIVLPHSNTLENYIEQIVISIPCNNDSTQTLLSAVYIPTNSSYNVYNLHFDTLDNIIACSNYENVIILGDYNIPTAQWLHLTNSQNFLTHAGTNPICNRLRDFMSTHDTKQYNHLNNSNSRILDLLICTTNCRVFRPNQDILQADKHHPPFCALLSLNIKFTQLRPQINPRYNYYRADYTVINTEIDKIDWNITLDKHTAEKSIDIFYDVIYGIIKNHVPLSKAKKLNFPSWFSTSLIHICKYKKKTWIKWKKYRNISDYELFSLYRARFTSECNKCYHKYVQNVEDSIPKNTKYFWTYISNRRNKSAIPSTMHYKNNTTSDPHMICNLFASFFQSVYEPCSLKANWRPQNSNIDTNNHLLSTIDLSLECVSKHLTLLDASKGAGPDGIPPRFLKYTAKTINKPLHIIFNRCLDNGIFPEVWRSANIIPVYKNGSKQNIENYRPISMLNSLSKLFEKLVHQAIYPFIKNNIIPEQHGFVKSKSTITNLVVFTNFLFGNMDKQIQTDAVYTDFKKAFDRVDHEILLEKVAYNGIRGNLLRWFQSYISYRNQTVVCNGYSSDAFHATSGIPQGSILGPLLFIIYVNDIGNCFRNSKFLMYADDLKIYISIKTINDCALLQDDLHRLSAYCDNNKLKLSLPKCKTINFTKNKNIINYPYSLCNEFLVNEPCISDLGILLDYKLHLNLHIDKITTKAQQMHNLVMRASSDFKRSTTFLQLFNSLVRPQIEYASVIWDPHYDKYSNAIERVQRRYLKSMFYKCRIHKSSYNESLQKFNLLTLKSRRLLLQAMLLYRLIHNEVNCPELINNIFYIVPRTVIQRRARTYPLFATNTSRTNAGERAPLHRIVNSYNKYFQQVDIFAVSRLNFRKEVINILQLNQLI